ncbi:MAG: alpha/beta hydrolase [Polyangiaceae bacterium]
MGSRNPIARQVHANGLAHRVLEWSGAEAAAPTVLLIHGFMDAGGTWDLVAPQLVAAGLRVIAPDLRGFGDSPRAPVGSYYHFPEYIADIAGISAELVKKEPLFVVGHSMGGTVATLFAGAFPERVSRLALLEGLGPPNNLPEHAPDRMHRWIADLAKYRSEPHRTMSREEALRRLCERHSGIDQEIVATRLPHLVTAVEGDRVVWKFDPLHRALSPFPFFASTYEAYAARIACQVLIVGGGPEGFHPEDEPKRIAAFKNVQSTTIDGAGHMMHWTRPSALAELLLGFLRVT